jgi:Lrp/AsnC family leucine-responsive transcriptional regulator
VLEQGAGAGASGAIAGYRAMVEPEAVGLTLDAFVQVSVLCRSRRVRGGGLCASGRDRLLYHGGEADYLLHVMARDVAHLDGLLRGELRRLPGWSGSTPRLA